MDRVVRVFDRSAAPESWPFRDIRREWIVTNGLGGYASGTLDGLFSRRYHGLLIAALREGRMMALNGLSERIRLPSRTVWYLGAEEISGVEVGKILPATQFRLEQGLPVWRYEVDDYIFEKRLVLPYRQNTVHVLYQLLDGPGTIRLGIRPTIHFRPHDAATNTPLLSNYRVLFNDRGYEVSADGVDYKLRLQLLGPSAAFTSERKVIPEILFPLEEERGYEFSGQAWSPGYFRTDLAVNQSSGLVASVDSWDAMLAMTSEQAWETETRRRQALLEMARPAAQSGYGPELVLAADAFLTVPGSRLKEAALAHAEGEEAWTVMAGYHWFTDWGRDTMISLEGLALMTGRHREARWILRSFARHIRDGLIPNMFPEGADEGLYHTADATMWFFHALDRYVTLTGDRETLDMLLPSLVDVIEHHLRGTRFGIHADPADGLLSQGQSGYQLTWMDAKVDDWVVTPRRGKAVEINGLWYNALSLMYQWLTDREDPRARRMRIEADRVRDAFNNRFWIQDKGYLYDVIDGPDGNDDACRPNQLLSFSLRHPVLDRSHWESVFDVVKKRLLTPMGLRTLAPGSPDYKAVYFGDLRSRDAAYHQGTVWAWLLGPFIDSYLKLHPGDHVAARRLLHGFAAHTCEACVGTISEIFDATAPFTARGCIAQAWSVAEVLRCWVLTAPAQAEQQEKNDAIPERGKQLADFGSRR